MVIKDKFTKSGVKFITDLANAEDEVQLIERRSEVIYLTWSNFLPCIEIDNICVRFLYVVHNEVNRVTS